MPIFQKPSLARGSKKSMPEGLWKKCPSCSEVIHALELENNYLVCPKCDHHFVASARERIVMFLDAESFEESDANLESVDPLEFRGYAERLKTYKARTGLSEACIAGRGKIEGISCSLAVMDFQFLGGSMNSVVGEKITRAIERATRHREAVIILSASGGARMYEGIFSLMQMAKTSGALARHAAAGLPFISILSHPTTGGVTASFATLGDVILAEPKSMIGFAGPRVVRETTHQDLPQGFQTAEFLLEHGLVDRIVPRAQMREELGALLRFFAEDIPEIPARAKIAAQAAADSGVTA